MRDRRVVIDFERERSGRRGAVGIRYRIGQVENVAGFGVVGQRVGVVMQRAQQRHGVVTVLRIGDDDLEHIAAAVIRRQRMRRVVPGERHGDAVDQLLHTVHRCEGDAPGAIQSEIVSQHATERVGATMSPGPPALPSTPGISSSSSETRPVRPADGMPLMKVFC